MLFEWQDILQFKPKRFFSLQCFFCFTIHCGRKPQLNSLYNKMDLVFYTGPRLIVMVDMSVDSQSTDGRNFGRAPVATGSTLGR